MKPTQLTTAILATALFALPAQAEELLGAALLDAIDGRHFDCLLGDAPLEWKISVLEEGASVVPYVAVVHGKTIEAEYTLTESGRLSSDGYGDERRLEQSEDGIVKVTRSDGRVMLCTAR